MNRNIKKNDMPGEHYLFTIRGEPEKENCYGSDIRLLHAYDIRGNIPEEHLYIYHGHRRVANVVLAVHRRI